ncbi:hypothetical protein CRG98_009917 [Punica granatum]|uniref:Uncharacterized protein n=1 Tax=Punica granatum TaxID=22663 RepID=A0A2I0KMP5_PUNGR|nr:hypothetical protein CRG98_009917 [Punica granatum]
MGFILFYSLTPTLTCNVWSISAYILSRAFKYPLSTIDLEPGSSSVLGRGGLTQGAWIFLFFSDVGFIQFYSSTPALMFNVWSISAYTLSRALKHPPSTIDLEPGSSSVLGRGGTNTRRTLAALDILGLTWCECAHARRHAYT